MQGIQHACHLMLTVLCCGLPSRQCGGPLTGMTFDDSPGFVRGIYLVVMEMHIRPEERAD